MKHKLMIAAAALALIAACKTNKQAGQPSAAAAPAPVVNLDTVKVSVNEAPKITYRESDPRLNDIIHTRLDVSFDWANSRLEGKATIEAKQHFYPSDMLYLNARGMDIKSVKVFERQPADNKKTAAAEKLTEVKSSYKYENDSLKINLGRVFTANESYQVQVEYTAKPEELKQGGSSAISSDKGLFFVNPKGDNPYKMTQVWTQGETQSNSAWFPTVDSPNEKMTEEIYMTVDDKYTTLSNGLLVDSKKNANGTRTDHWKMDQPHAPYLVMMAVGQFRKVVDEPWNGKEISYYVEKEYEPHAKGIFGDTREMVEFYSKRLGFPYPWPKYAQVAVRDYVSGAMENTSATLHGDFVVYQTTREMIDGKKGEDVIAHELFHQWFGDVVTCESWSNLPLNESFATYGEYLWQEYKHGRDAADHHHASSRMGYKMSGKEVNLVRFDYEHREEMFDAFSYNKGGQVLHMLRKAVGDDAFFASLKLYLETNKFKPAEMHNLRLAFEEVTGKDMNWFFNQWFFNKGRPNLKVDKKYDAATGTVELSVEQTQDFKKYPLYRLPVEVDVYCDGKASRTRIWITEQKQSFKLKAASQPQLVNFDAERQLLCDLDYPKTEAEYIFQYKNAPLYDDRHEALEKLDGKLGDVAIFEIFKTAAENDRFAPLRSYAISKLTNAPAEKMNEVKQICMNIYNKDPKTKVRARALNFLNKKFGSDAEVMALNEKGLNEQSYAINGEAFQAIAEKNPKLALEKSKLFENEPGKDLIFPIAALYAEHGSDEQLPYFQNMMRYVNGFEQVTFISSYAKTAKRCSMSGALTAAADFEIIARSGNRFSKYAALKGMKDLIGVWDGKEKALKAKIEEAKSKSADVSALEKELKEASEGKAQLQKMYSGVKS